SVVSLGKGLRVLDAFKVGRAFEGDEAVVKLAATDQGQVGELAERTALARKEVAADDVVNDTGRALARILVVPVGVGGAGVKVFEVLLDVLVVHVYPYRDSAGHGEEGKPEVADRDAIERSADGKEFLYVVPGFVQVALDIC